MGRLCGVRTRRQLRVTTRICRSVGNGRGTEARQGAMRIFLRTAKPACVAVPAKLREAGPRARPVCDGEALSPDGLLLVPRNGRRPLPQTAGEGCLRPLLLSWKKRTRAT